jgi:hypothetical protein
MKCDPELVSLIFPIWDEKIVDMAPTSLHCHHRLDEEDLNLKEPIMEQSAFLAEMIHPSTL